jgi:hypothetical protein
MNDRLIDRIHPLAGIEIGKILTWFEINIQTVRRWMPFFLGLLSSVEWLHKAIPNAMASWGRG